MTTLTCPCGAPFGIYSPLCDRCASASMFTGIPRPLGEMAPLPANLPQLCAEDMREGHTTQERT